MPYVSYVEFNVPDAQKASAFYKQVFAWEAKGWGGDQDYLIAAHGEEPGIDIALRKAPDGKPLSVAIITVPSLDETLKAVQSAGGVVVVEKFPIAGVGYAAYFTDPGGLIVGIHEYDETAK
jgi:hypothetical protein